MTRRRLPSSRSMRSATPFSASTAAVSRRQRELPVEPVLEPALAHLRRARRLEAEHDVDDADGDRGAEQARALERRVGLRQPRQQRLRDLREQRARLVDAVGRDRAVAARVPRLEEALEHLVDEPAARPRRERRLVLRRFLEPQHVGGEELERAVLVALERAQRERCRPVAAGRAAERGRSRRRLQPELRRLRRQRRQRIDDTGSSPSASCSKMRGVAGDPTRPCRGPRPSTSSSSVDARHDRVVLEREGRDARRATRAAAADRRTRRARRRAARTRRASRGRAGSPANRRCCGAGAPAIRRRRARPAARDRSRRTARCRRRRGARRSRRCAARTSALRSSAAPMAATSSNSTGAASNRRYASRSDAERGENRRRAREAAARAADRQGPAGARATRGTPGGTSRWSASGAAARSGSSSRATCAQRLAGATRDRHRARRRLGLPPSADDASQCVELAEIARLAERAIERGDLRRRDSREAAGSDRRSSVRIRRTGNAASAAARSPARARSSTLTNENTRSSAAAYGSAGERQRVEHLARDAGRPQHLARHVDVRQRLPHDERHAIERRDCARRAVSCFTHRAKPATSSSRSRATWARRAAGWHQQHGATRLPSASRRTFLDAGQQLVDALVERAGQRGVGHDDVEALEAGHARQQIPVDRAQAVRIARAIADGEHDVTPRPARRQARARRRAACARRAARLGRQPLEMAEGADQEPCLPHEPLRAAIDRRARLERAERQALEGGDVLLVAAQRVVEAKDLRDEARPQAERRRGVVPTAARHATPSSASRSASVSGGRPTGRRSARRAVSSPGVIRSGSATAPCPGARRFSIERTRCAAAARVGTMTRRSRASKGVPSQASDVSALAERAQIRHPYEPGRPRRNHRSCGGSSSVRISCWARDSSISAPAAADEASRAVERLPDWIAS